MWTEARWPTPLWIAHRGAGTLAPENTLAAFRLGAWHGYRHFECDAKLSADDVPFLLHDATLERTSSGRGAAGALRWDELARLDAGAWHGAPYAGEAPPRLEQIARFVIAGGHHLNIELKPSPGRESDTGRIVALAAAALWQGLPPPLLSSFKPVALSAARDAAPGLPRALLLEHLRPSWLEEALALGCIAVVTDQVLMDAEVLARARGAGLKALCYTVNEPSEVERLLKLGVDGLITDAVDRYAPTLKAGDPIR